MEVKPRLGTSDRQERYAASLHEAGHAVAACSVGFGLQRRGIVLRGREGMTYTRGPGLRSRNPEMRQRFHRENIVVAFAGPAAEYRVNRGLVHIDDDVQNIALSLRELLPRKNHFIENACGYGKYWGEFWAIIYTLATSNERQRALAELDEFPGLAAIDMAVFETLWPLAQRARAIIDLHWSTVEEISNELIRTGRPRGDEIEEIISRDQRHFVMAACDAGAGFF